jgi:hypothetical protein
MRRVSVEFGRLVGATAGVMAGTIGGVVVALANPCVGIVGGAVLALILCALGATGGGATARLLNRVAELMDPQTVPPDGPEADYHDIHPPPT